MKTTSDKWRVTGDKRNVATCEAHSCHVSRVTRHASAFTLIEIMVAMAIFSVVIVAIYSTWTLILRASQVGQRTAAQAQRQRIALRTIEDSLACIQSFQASLKYYSFIVQNGDQPVLSFTARLPEVFPRNGRFGGFNLRRLIFSVERGPGAETDLVLRQTPVLMDMDPDERQTPLVLARDVKKFTVECWNPRMADWVDEWNTTNSIPAMLRISFTLGGNAGAGNAAPELPVTRVIAIPSVMLPSGLQAGGGGGGASGIYPSRPPPSVPVPGLQGGGGGGNMNRGILPPPRRP
jgi:prepilin-type N-terminal cleavage/methylation domain-containing protein